MYKDVKTIVIIGAGPAGLTAAYELQEKSQHRILVIEATDQYGGISKTVNYKGNRIDIGGHRFFSKSDRVLDWWQQFLPIVSDQKEFVSTYQNSSKSIRTNNGVESEKPHFVVRPRLSRIIYKKHFFDYPVKVSLSTFRGFGLRGSVKIVLSLLWVRFFPVKPENSLEDFYINRFGKGLYEAFFKAYTYKVWGEPCSQISADWGRQRVKGVSIRRLITHQLKNIFAPSRQRLGNRGVEQSLTEYFLYPPKGPGQLWETVAGELDPSRVTVRMNSRVVNIKVESALVKSVTIADNKSRETVEPCDFLVSSMPIKDLIQGIGKIVPDPIRQIAQALPYRDFMIVGLLLKDLKLKNKDGSPIKDNWLYIQNDDVLVGRLQLFHNWSDQMTARADQYWIGAEYFCHVTDTFWNMDDDLIIEQAKMELEKIGIIDPADYLDGTVVRMPKAYPSYSGEYANFPSLKDFLNEVDNLFPVGRNGMHKYNNQDHSMLTAMLAAEQIISGDINKAKIWDVNTEQEYHESTTEDKRAEKNQSKDHSLAPK